METATDCLVRKVRKDNDWFAENYHVLHPLVEERRTAHLNLA